MAPDAIGAWEAISAVVMVQAAVTRLLGAFCLPLGAALDCSRAEGPSFKAFLEVALTLEPC